MGLNIFNLPSLSQVVTSARAAMSAALPGTNAYLWPNNTYPAAKAFGGMIWSAYQRLDFVGRQTFALFAEGQYLDDHGAELNLARKGPTAAIGNVIMTAGSGGGLTATAGTSIFLRADGAQFTATSTAGVSAGGSISVAVAGVAGAASNTEASTPMTLGSGFTGPGYTGATALVDNNGLSSGADTEPDGLPQTRDLSTYRGRILFRKANPAQGGSPADYVGWALTVAGVTRVYVERRWAGAGTVRVFPLFDTYFPSVNGVPDSFHVNEVNSVLQPLAPAGCALTVAAPTQQVINVTVANLNPNTAAAQAAVQAELLDTFSRLGAVAGGDTPFPGMNYLATPYNFMALFIEQAVANAAGVISADVSATDTPISPGSIPVLGALTYM
jgi:uncharacterized phage protein gp47/JayE